MLKSYLNSALRHLFKNKTYSILNALGLSVGLACFTLIGLWVKDELSYDRFHQNADLIYRIGGIFIDESGKSDQAVTPVPLGPALVADFPEVDAAIRIDKNDATVKYGTNQYIEDNILLTDPAFLRMFDFKLLQGNPETCLKEPYSIVLSSSMAKKYFANTDPMDKSLKIFLYDPDGNGMEYKVTGIIEDCPSNSQFQYNFLVSFSTFERANPGEINQWYNNGYYTYLMLKPGSNPGALEAKFPGMIEKYMGKTNREWKISYDYFLQPLTGIHLNSHLRYEIEPTSSNTYVFIFGTVGMIVLFLACINYVNLSTAVSSDRFKEVGMRKVMGAARQQLIGQYLVESWLMVMGSLLLAFVWIETTRSVFETLTGKQINDLYTWSTLLTLVTIATMAGIFSGLYPSFMLSSFRPINILKGQLRSGSKGIWLRKGLVVLQYSITIILVIGILVVQMQLNFIQNKDLGYNKDQLMVLGVNGSREVINGYDAFSNELSSHTMITGMARSSSSLAGGLGNSVGEMEDPSGKKLNATIYRNRVDFDYLDVYKLKLLAGRFFSKDVSSDSTKGFVVNESTIKNFGYQDPAAAVGKVFNFQGRDGQVIGVVSDFHFNSLQYKVEPVCIYLLRGGFSRITVRFNGNLNEVTATVTELWKKHFPNSVIDFKFAEDSLNSQYQSEYRFSQVFIIFSSISLAIACLGLFALVSYTVESRTKEIGIRKVLGASVSNILAMLSREFLTLIFFSAVIAIPIGYYFMSNWLNGFAYRIELHPMVFVLAGTLVLVIAWITVSLRTARAATANPVDSLRTE